MLASSVKQQFDAIGAFPCRQIKEREGRGISIRFLLNVGIGVEQSVGAINVAKLSSDQQLAISLYRRNRCGVPPSYPRECWREVIRFYVLLSLLALLVQEVQILTQQRIQPSIVSHTYVLGPS